MFLVFSDEGASSFISEETLHFEVKFVDSKGLTTLISRESSWIDKADFQCGHLTKKDIQYVTVCCVAIFFKPICL